MQGRLENKMKTEEHIKRMIADAPDYMNRYYYSLSSKTHETKLRYITNVVRFLKYVGNGNFPGENQLKEIDAYQIQLYISEIGYIEDPTGAIKELSEATKCNIYSCLNSFFTFLSRPQGRDRFTYIDYNPFDNRAIERPRIVEGDIIYLEPHEVIAVEKTILNGVGTPASIARQREWRYRDLLLFRMPVVNGLRVTALSEIDINDIDFDNKTIRVVEKGNITRTVDYDDKTSQFLNIWIRQRKQLLESSGSESNALFISNQRTRITTRSIENLIVKYTKNCPETSEKHITPHKLRTSCGTNVYQATGDIQLVSKVLGHKTTVPTRRYAAVKNNSITSAINQVASLY